MTISCNGIRFGLMRTPRWLASDKQLVNLPTGDGRPLVSSKSSLLGSLEVGQVWYEPAATEPGSANYGVGEGL